MICLFSQFLIDSIEANVENAVVHVEKGGEELKQAVNYQV